MGSFGPETLKAGPKIAPSLPGSLGRQTEVAVWSSSWSSGRPAQESTSPRSRVKVFNSSLVTTNERVLLES